MERSPTDPDSYIASLPVGIRDDVAALDVEVRAIMQGHERVLWEGVMWGGTEQHIIGYGAQRTANRSGKDVDWFLIGLARQKDYLSVYVNAVEDGGYLVKRYADRLGRARVGSAVIRFGRMADLDMPVLRELLTRARDLATRP
jgi:hypothetical protein